MGSLSLFPLHCIDRKITGLDMNSSRKENIIQNATCAVHVNKKELNHNY